MNKNNNKYKYQVGDIVKVSVIISGMDKENDIWIVIKKFNRSYESMDDWYKVMNIQNSEDISLLEEYKLTK